MYNVHCMQDSFAQSLIKARMVYIGLVMETHSQSFTFYDGGHRMVSTIGQELTYTYLLEKIHLYCDTESLHAVICVAVSVTYSYAPSYDAILRLQ